MQSCNLESCLPPFCCQEGKCVNSTSCPIILCGKSLCDRDCCKKNSCLLKYECFVEKNIYYFYGILAFLVVVFLIFGRKWNKQLQEAIQLRKKKKKKKRIIAVNPDDDKILEKKMPKNNEIEEEKAKDAQLKNITEPLQNELIITEREEFINNSGSYVSNSKEFAFLSNEKKNVQNYVIKNNQGSVLRINLKAFSQTANKLVRFSQFGNDSKKNKLKRNKTIHIGEAYSGILDTSSVHKKYQSLKGDPSNHSGNKTP